MPKSKPSDWEWYWKNHFGVPAFQQWRPRGAALPLIESEAGYLLRLNMTPPAERAAIDRADLEPVELNPFGIVEADLDKLDRLTKGNVTSGESLVDPEMLRRAVDRNGGPPR